MYVNFLSRSTIGGVGDRTTPSPVWSSKQPLPGIGLHDPLHGRQACPEFTPFHQGVGKICPREGLFSCRPLPKRGQICDIPDPPNLRTTLLFYCRLVTANVSDQTFRHTSPGWSGCLKGMNSLLFFFKHYTIKSYNPKWWMLKRFKCVQICFWTRYPKSQNRAIYFPCMVRHILAQSTAAEFY